jgi:hypothetical protein
MIDFHLAIQDLPKNERDNLERMWEDPQGRSQLISEFEKFLSTAIKLSNLKGRINEVSK